MNVSIDPRLLALVERVTIPAILLCVLGAVGFFGAASPTPLADVFWVLYGGLWLIGLLFVAWYDGQQRESSVVEATDPVALLQTRYAAGEIPEETFERMLDTLLESPHPATTTAGRERVPDLER